LRSRKRSALEFTNDRSGRSFPQSRPATRAAQAGRYSCPLAIQRWQGSANEILFIGRNQGNDDLNVNMAGFGLFTVAGTRLFDGNERHLAVVFDQETSQIRVFVDKELIHTRKGVAGTFTGGSRLLIGATGQASDERWLGWIDEVRLTDSALQFFQFLREPRN
jgi:hypothetical protein